MSNSNQVIEEGLKEFDKLFGHNSVCSPTGLIEIKSFLRTFAEKIYKEIREEVIGEVELKIKLMKDRVDNSFMTPERGVENRAYNKVLKALKEK